MDKIEKTDVIAAKIDRIHEDIKNIHSRIEENNKKNQTLMESIQKMSMAMQVIAQHYGQIIPIITSIQESSNISLRNGCESSRIRCIFLVHSIAMWNSLADIYDRMRKDHRFEPLVLSTYTRHHGHGDFYGENDVSSAFDRMGIPHLRLNMPNSYEGLSILKSLRPDVIFRQQPWDCDVMPAFTTRELNFARLCMVPYGVFVLQGDFIASNNGTNTTPSHLPQPNAYDQAYHRAAWRIFCETEMSVRLFQSFQHSDPKKFILSGCPKFDYLLRSKGHGVWPLPEPNGRSFRVIWAPHHSVYNNPLNFGVFNRIYADMLAWARNSPDIQFVFKPHPALSSGVIASGIMNAQQYEGYLRQWNALENCAIETGEYGDLFDASDMMITDSLSFLTEYPLFDKPLVFFDSGKHAAFNAIGELAVSCTRRVYSFSEMKDAVIFYKNGGAWEFESEREQLKHILQPEQVPASEIILDSIYNDMKDNNKLFE